MAITFSWTSEISAPCERVWEVLQNVEGWPDWTSTMQAIKGLDSPDLGIGRRFRVKQPRFAPAIYTVTDLEVGRAFAWESKLPGIRTRADHRLSVSGSGTEVVLIFEYYGLIGVLLGSILNSMTKQYLQTEAAGLAQACKAAQSPVPAVIAGE